MKYLFIFLFPMFSYGQIKQDSVGYVQPWLSERGQVVWMNTMAMDIRNVEFDTLSYWIEFQFPAGTAPYKSTVTALGLTFEPTLGLPCYAIKGIDNTYGQVWEMYLPNRRRVETLLLSGFKTTRIVQTGQK